MWGRPAGDESDTDSDGDLILHSSLSVKETERKKIDVPIADAPPQILQNQEQSVSLHITIMKEELRESVMKGNIMMTKEIIESGFDVDMVLKDGSTALMYACQCSYFDIVNYLLEKGANPNFNQDHYTPLMALCASITESPKLIQCFESLIRHGANVNAKEKKSSMTPILFAAKNGHGELIKLLIQHGVDIDAQDSSNWTALCWAAYHGQGKIVKILLENKSNPEHKTLSGEVPANLARNQGFSAIADILEKYNSPASDPSLLEKLPAQEKKTSELKIIEGCYTSKIKKYGDLELFLSGLSLSHVLQVFEDQQISFQTLLTLTDEELEKVGVEKFGERKLILDNLRNIHKKKWEDSSINTFKDKNYLSCPEIYAIMENISKHLGYIQSTIQYVRVKIHVSPKDLEVGKDVVNVFNLGRQTKLALENVERLQGELQTFKMQLEKEESKVENQPATDINMKPEKSVPLQKVLIITGGSVAVALLVLKLVRSWQ